MSIKNLEKEQTVFAILVAISLGHAINDMLQSLIFATYPILKNSYSLSFSQIGLISMVYQISASLLQPLVGQYTDKNHRPYSLVFGMFCTLLGLMTLAFAGSFAIILIAVAVIGAGSSIFHPEASRIARIAGKGQHGFAQSFFQVGGNVGTAIGPLLAAFVILQKGQTSIAWFCLAAFLGMILLGFVGSWYNKAHLANKGQKKHIQQHNLSKNTVVFSFVILILLVFSKFFYIESIKSYYTFYLIDVFGISIKSAQINLFLFLLATAIGVLVGGIIGDKYGRKLVIWVSILGSLPFTFLLPYCNLLWTEILIFIIGLIMSSAFSAIIVYAQELIPTRIGMVSGLFFGFGFGVAGISSAILGRIADTNGIEFVYYICSFLPIIGLLTCFLPNLKKRA